MSTGLAGGRSRSVGPFIIILIGLVVALASVGPTAPRAGAHTDLLQGSPGPGQRVGGTVDFVDLVFLAPVREVVIEVRDPGGEVIAGEMEVADGQIIRYAMEALIVEGRYLIDYEMISDDGDLTQSGYFFVYEEGAFEPVRLGEVDVPGPPIVTARNAVGAVLVVVLGLICVVLANRFWRARAALDARRGSGKA